MVKTRFTSLDVTAEVKNLRQELIGLRVANIYDINSKTYVLKLVKPDKKCYLLIESGTRFHLTNFSRDKNTIPSVFTLKLRKHLRTKRLERINQLGMDRVVVFSFGTEPVVHHLIIEFYASGNIILTDENYKILTLLRTHKYDEEVSVSVSQVYPFQTAKPFKPFDSNVLIEKLQQVGKEDSSATLKKVLFETTDLGSLITESCILSSGFALEKKISECDTQQLSVLVASLKEHESLLNQLDSTINKGYIIYQEKKKKKEESQEKKKKRKEKKKKSGKQEVQEEENEKGEKEESQIETKEKMKPSNNNAESSNEQASTDYYDEFLPILFRQYVNRKVQEFPTFNDAVDQFYSQIEHQKIESQKSAQEEAALQRLEKVKQDQMRRIEDLKNSEQANIRKAQLIELNKEDIEKVLLIINGALANSMNWTQLARVVKEEKKNGNPIAAMIHRLKLETNQVTLLLTENKEDEDEDSLTRPAETVDINISLSALANAREYYEQKKKDSVKAQKTIDAAENAIKAAEKKTKKDLKAVEIKTKIQQIRKPFWFEKFYWFVSSDNYLVIGGKDAQQNELIYRRHLKNGDIYVHADLHGASSCVIKNPSGKPIPPNTLLQAGTMSVCRSSAWNEKVVTSAWWVYHHQVSKTAPTGEYLTTGSFMIRGKKNYLPASNLIMGFGIWFKLHEECIPKHLGERQARTIIDEENQEGADQEKEEEMEEYNSDDSQEGKEKEKEEKNQESEEEKKRRKEEKKKKSQEKKERRTLKNEEPNPPSPTSTEPKTSAVRAFGFGLNSSNLEEEDDDFSLHAKSQENKPKSKQRISAKARKELKKKKSSGQSTKEEKNEKQEENEENEEGNEEEEEEEEESQENEEVEESQENEEEEEEGEKKNTKEKNAPTPKNQTAKQDNKKGKKNEEKKTEASKNIRGKKGKLKKMKEKYADQDEEERQQKMALLGHRNLNDSGEISKKKSKKEHKDEKKTEGTNPGPTTSIPTEILQELIPDLKQPSETKDQPKDRKTRRKEEKDEIKFIMEEENITKLNEEEKDKLTELDSLTGVPLPDDILLFAVPICAPYSVLSKDKFKIKLIPGSQKRGKASKQALEIFLRFPNITQQEKDLIKALGETELTQQMLGNVKLSTPGLHNQPKKKKK